MKGDLNINDRDARHDEVLAEEAVEWHELMTAKPSRATREKFVKWLKASPLHVREYLIAASWDGALGEIDSNRRIDVDRLLSELNVVQLPANRTQAATPQPPRRSWAGISRVAAGIAAAAVLLVAAPFVREHWNPNTFATQFGEQRSVSLADGSIVALNTASKVRIDFTAQERTVHLKAGQAMFSVAHDPARPFRVHVGNAVVQAVGTKFDVRVQGNRTSVAVIEGRVQITANEQRDAQVAETLNVIAERVGIAAGQTVTILEDRLTPPAPINVAEVAAWQQRRLVFRNHTLAEMVDEFARYTHTPRIRIEDEQLAARRYSGVFDADSPQMLLKYLASDDTVAVDEQGGVVVLRSVATQPETAD